MFCDSRAVTERQVRYALHIVAVKIEHVPLREGQSASRLSVAAIGPLLARPIISLTAFFHRRLFVCLEELKTQQNL